MMFGNAKSGRQGDREIVSEDSYMFGEEALWSQRFGLWGHFYHMDLSSEILRKLGNSLEMQHKLPGSFFTFLAFLACLEVASVVAMPRSSLMHGVTNSSSALP